MVDPIRVAREGRNCWRIERAERVSLLVDGADYFTAFVRAAARARRSIYILAWDFDSRTWLGPEPSLLGLPDRLGPFLNILAKRNRRLQVRILDWDFPVIYGLDRETPPIFGAGWRFGRRVHFRFDDALPAAASHHQKVVVIDDALAFVGGMDLTHDRWDTPSHRAVDPLRTHQGRMLGPVHDVMMAVDGPAAAALGGLARDRWHMATGKRSRLNPDGADVWPEQLPVHMSGVPVAIARSQPQYRHRPEAREVEALYLDSIRAARRFIYVENQYFTSTRIGDALAQRLQDPQGPDMVLVLRRASDGWLEAPTMGALRTALLRRLHDCDRYGRLHVYFPQIPGLEAGAYLNLHSKLMIVDDELLRIGSSNLNNRSMGWDTECDLFIESGGREDVCCAIAQFRERLLAEHLGVSEAQVRDAVARSSRLSDAVERLRSDGRSLVPLQDQEAWPELVQPIAEVFDMERPATARDLVEQFVPQENVRQSGYTLLLVALLVAALGALFALWRWTPLEQWVTVEAVTAWGEIFKDDFRGPLMVMGAYLVASVIMFPRPLISLAAVILFGPWLGFAYAISGILIAASITYGLGRLVREDTVRRVAGDRLSRLSHHLSRRGLLAVVALRLLPIAPFIVVNMVAGAVRVRFSHYFFGTAIAMTPGLLATTAFGSQVGAVLRGGDVNEVVLLSVAAAALAVFWAVRKLLAVTGAKVTAV